MGGKEKPTRDNIRKREEKKETLERKCKISKFNHV